MLGEKVSKVNIVPETHLKQINTINMSKRLNEDTATNGLPRPADREKPAPAYDEADQFEDEFEDEFESEDEIMVAGEDGRPDEEVEAEAAETAMQVDSNNQTFMVGRNKLSKDEILEPDETAYEMLHRLEPPWPCLSFDIIRDHLGEGRARKRYPATVYSVAGTQAARGHEKENELLVMKMSKLSRNARDEEDDSSSDDSESDEDEDADPILETKKIRLDTVTNRIRAYQTQSDPSRPFATTLTASMAESGAVLIHDITSHLTSFDTPGTTITPQQNQPIHTIRAHKSNEGYALDWQKPASSSSTTNSTAQTPSLLTGDTAGHIYHTTSTPSGSFTTSSSFQGHTSSVEELQWSPSEPFVFASASADSTIRIWDTRSKRRTPAISVTASETDVNVLSWSHLTPYLLASGDDSGRLSIWDLRAWQRTPKQTTHTPIADFAFHKEQITSVEWHPTDDSIVSVCAGDDTLTLWDLAVELDDEESKDTAGVEGVPPQLLFVHYMEGVKESHWHGQMDGVVMATGASGWNVFRTISV